MKKKDYNDAPAIGVIGLTNVHGVEILEVNDETCIYRLSNENKARQGKVYFTKDDAKFRSCIGSLSLSNAMRI